MTSIRLADVSFAFPQQQSLIADCTVDLPNGWTGIVGRNGCGKSTLLDLIDGTRRPATGRVDLGDLRLGRVAQGPATSEAVADFAHAYTAGALRWMSLLDLDPGDYWRWEELSPGVRRRWQIGAALFDEPGALLLDEPTNHIDADGRDLLVAALRRFEGVGLVVSHDRALLDALCDRTLRLDGHAARLYPAGYSAAREVWLADEARVLAELEAAQGRVRGLQAEVADRKRRHASAASSLSSRSRMKSVRDSDARGLSAKSRAQRAEASIGRGRGVAQANLDRARRELAELDRPNSSGGSIFVDGARAPREVVLRFEASPLQIEGRLLRDRVALSVHRDDRVWLQGPNGCGKSTLLRAMVEAGDLPSGRLLWVPQVLDRTAVLSGLAELGAEDRARALQIAAALGLDVRLLVDATALSPGELRKVTVATGLVREPWLVMLDEPTNDLDLAAVEALEEALAGYRGALVVVTHDPAFARATELEPLQLFDVALSASGSRASRS